MGLKELVKKIVHPKSMDEIVKGHLEEELGMGGINVEWGPFALDITLNCADIEDLKKISPRAENSNATKKVYKIVYPCFHYRLPNLVIEKIENSTNKVSIPYIEYHCFPRGNKTRYRDELVSQKSMILTDKNGERIYGSIKATNPDYNKAVFATVGNIVDVTLQRVRDEIYKIEEFKESEDKLYGGQIKERTSKSR